MLPFQSLVSEEDEDEDDEEGKTAVQADEKMKNNKPGLHGALLLSSINKKLSCDGGGGEVFHRAVHSSRRHGFPESRQRARSCQILLSGHQGCHQVLAVTLKNSQFR